MPSKTVASDVSSTKATYGSTEVPSNKQTDTSFHAPAGYYYPAGKTKREEKIRQNETLVGVGSHFTNGKISMSNFHKPLPAWNLSLTSHNLFEALC
ncbi:uncharacterized protein FIESC28_08611 [Fusarium coffeatum]|uniref:Uncharacterized protein n=1 Tax=Fusarium coffeatum TaxID=231269 RepID=A0A366R5R4_9HYPO|nr:uncharacterized protein FIESC28_08611 [Fusarium coffeatum]RBR12487.1 hypothetical protein FIESC28_08611 [Fusarium coffeatum]